MCLKVIDGNGTRGKRVLWKSWPIIQNVLYSGHAGVKLTKLYALFSSTHWVKSSKLTLSVVCAFRLSNFACTLAYQQFISNENFLIRLTRNNDLYCCTKWRWKPQKVPRFLSSEPSAFYHPPLNWQNKRTFSFKRLDSGLFDFGISNALNKYQKGDSAKNCCIKPRK